MTITEMIKSFQTLSPDEQDSLLEILRNYQAKRREAEILANVRELKEAIALGTAKVGTVEELIADLNEVEDEDIME
jgi:TRAP-type C4-dicarboxylate transport system substrate-binding protein